MVPVDTMVLYSADHVKNKPSFQRNAQVHEQKHMFTTSNHVMCSCAQPLMLALTFVPIPLLIPDGCISMDISLCRLI